VIFSAIPLTGRIGAIDDVGKPGGSVVVVVLVDVLVVVEVVVEEVVVGAVVETVVDSLETESLEQAVMTSARVLKITRNLARAVKIGVFPAKLSRFTSCTLEE
jgi:hypothetical protein